MNYIAVKSKGWGIQFSSLPPFYLDYWEGAHGRVGNEARQIKPFMDVERDSMGLMTGPRAEVPGGI